MVNRVDTVLSISMNSTCCDQRIEYVKYQCLILVRIFYDLLVRIFYDLLVRIFYNLQLFLVYRLSFIHVYCICLWG